MEIACKVFLFFIFGLWIPCDLGCINGVDSSFFFFLEFCVDFGDFFFK